MLLSLLTPPARPAAEPDAPMGINRRNRSLIEALNPRAHRKLADDKVLAKERLVEAGAPVADTYGVIDSFLEVTRFEEIVAGRGDFVLKPARGRGGSGIVVLEESHGHWNDTRGRVWRTRDIHRRLGNILFGDYAGRISDRALIEQRLRPGAILGTVPQFGLPDFRIITLDSRPLMAMLRLPTRRSNGRANLHAGALGLGIDLERGITTRAVHRGQLIDCHPDSGQPLLDRPIESWDAIERTARQAAAAFPLRYLGVDIALDVFGDPRVLEVNVRPGLEIQNANGRSLEGALREATQG